jgi:Glu-tRNA(Gln) amidotransferase subunit E-like FAD-binding protein
MKGAPIVTNIKVKQGMEQLAHNQMSEMRFDSEKEIVFFMVHSQEFCQFLTEFIQYLKRITENDSDMDTSATKDTNSDIELASNDNEDNREIGLESNNERMQDLTMMAERLLNTLANQNNFNRVVQGIFQLVKEQSEQQKKERSQKQDPDKKQSSMKTKELSMLDLAVPPKELTKFLEMFWDLYLELDNNEVAKRFF